jgi:hypothetical protein
LIGPGADSLDSLLKLRLPQPLTGIVLALGTLATVSAALGSRRLPASGKAKGAPAA